MSFYFALTLKSLNSLLFTIKALHHQWHLHLTCEKWWVESITGCVRPSKHDHEELFPGSSASDCSIFITHRDALTLILSSNCPQKAQQIFQLPQLSSGTTRRYHFWIGVYGYPCNTSAILLCLKQPIELWGNETRHTKTSKRIKPDLFHLWLWVRLCV